MARGVGTLPVTPSPVLVHPTHPPLLPPPVATDGDGCCPDSHICNQTKRRTKTRNATSTYVVSGEDLPTPTKDVSVSPVGGGGGRSIWRFFVKYRGAICTHLADSPHPSRRFGMYARSLHLQSLILLTLMLQSVKATLCAYPLFMCIVYHRKPLGPVLLLRLIFSRRD
jgi:hypothetical protein